jgi:hypothetical protein
MAHVVKEEVSGALQKLFRKIQCHNILILNLEKWLPTCSTQQFQGLDVAGTHVTNCGNNLHSCILACTKNLIQAPHQEVSASTAAAVSKWLLPMSMQTTSHEN